MLALSDSVLGVLVVVTALAALGVYWTYLRLFGPRFVDCHQVLLTHDSPERVIGLVRLAAQSRPHYTYRRTAANRLEIIYGDTFPDEAAEDPLPDLANAILDLLVVTANPVQRGTEVHLRGRAEPSLIKAIRHSLDAVP
jgi:hypothetical protein